jgi:hypothetical protein
MAAESSAALPRWIRGLSWLLLAAGWWLVWRGQGALGCALVALFAVIRFLAARRSSVPVPAAPIPEAVATASPPTDAAFANPFDPWQEGNFAETPETPLPPVIEDTDERSTRPERWRRLVWVSYGNAFLHGKFDLEQWFRHCLARQAVCTFRDGADRGLIAGDGFEWLSDLRQRGALRLSLDVDESTPEPDGVTHWDSQAVTCHFPDHRERWCMGEETSLAARQAEAMTWEQRAKAYPIAHRGNYLPDLDAYWRTAILPGAEPETPIDWSRERAAVERALLQAGIAAVSHEPGPFFVGRYDSDPAWSHFPVLPDDPALSIPHRLLKELLSRKGRWENDTNPKNEGSLYAMSQGNAEATQAIENQGALLSALIGRIQRLAGSETRWKPRPPPRV